MTTKIEAVSIFINNSPNRAVVREKRWGGAVLADCGPDNAENMARARLIAAAPELAEVVRKLACDINGMNATMRATNKDYADSALCQQLTELMCDATEALAKAGVTL